MDRGGPWLLMVVTTLLVSWDGLRSVSNSTSSSSRGFFFVGVFLATLVTFLVVFVVGVVVFVVLENLFFFEVGGDRADSESDDDDDDDDADGEPELELEESGPNRSSLVGGVVKVVGLVVMSMIGLLAL